MSARGAGGADEFDGEYDPGSEADQSDDENAEGLEEDSDDSEANGDVKSNGDPAAEESELNQSHATPPAMSPDMDVDRSERPPSKESLGTEESLSLQFSVDEASQQMLPESIRK